MAEAQSRIMDLDNQRSGPGPNNDLMAGKDESNDRTACVLNLGSK